MNKSNKVGIVCAVIAAILYAINSPTSKILLEYIPSTIMAGFLYLGAGIGMIPVALIRNKIKNDHQEIKLTKMELPYTIAMILLDIAAPILLLFGLKSITAESASLLNNFEIVATAIIALTIFKEKISLRLWFGIIFITASCLLLSVENIEGIKLSYGAIFVLLACICWGFENNCTRKMELSRNVQSKFTQNLKNAYFLSFRYFSFVM